MKKTIRLYRYDLNQIPYNHTVQVTNRFQGLDLIYRVSEELWRFVTLYRRQSSRLSPRKRKAKWLSEEALQIAEKKTEGKGKGEKEVYIHLNAEFHLLVLYILKRVLFLFFFNINVFILIRG